jgi:hypothetical protein
MHDLRRICALQSVSGESMTSDGYCNSLDTFASALTDVELSSVIQRLQTEGTHRNPRKLPYWFEWDAAFDAQLDAHCKAGSIGRPVPRPHSLDGQSMNVLCIQWNNLVRLDGTRKCHACLDGSQQSAPWLRQFTQTYACPEECVQISSTHQRLGYRVLV